MADKDTDTVNYLALNKDGTLYLANAKFNKTSSSVSGATRNTRGGNPWFDPSTGRFANGPPGVTVLSGGKFLSGLSNAEKKNLSDRAAMTGATAISAVLKNGQVLVFFHKAGAVIAKYAVPSAPVNQPQGAVQNGNQDPMAISSVPPGVDPEQWSKRMDAVRDAARELDQMGHGDVREFLQGRTTRDLTDQEINQFLKDVERQRISDLVDVLDHSFRRSIATMARSRRHVRLVPPRGWVRKSMNGLPDEAVVELHRRLSARGFDDTQLTTFMLARYTDVRKARLQSLIGGDIPKGK